MIRKNVLLTVIAVVIYSGVVFAAGPVTEQKEYYDNGKVEKLSKVNDMGDVLSERYYREDGTLQQYIGYDAGGHKIAEANYDGRGKLEENADGWAAMRWKYINGKMAGEGYYGEDGKLTERKQYNKEDDLVAKQYYGDKDPLPSEEYQPDPTLAGETTSYYDSYGRPQMTTSVGYDDWFPGFWELDD